MRQLLKKVKYKKQVNLKMDGLRPLFYSNPLTWLLQLVRLKKSVVLGQSTEKWQPDAMIMINLNALVLLG